MSLNFRIFWIWMLRKFHLHISYFILSGCLNFCVWTWILATLNMSLQHILLKNCLINRQWILNYLPQILLRAVNLCNVIYRLHKCRNLFQVLYGLVLHIFWKFWRIYQVWKWRNLLFAKANESNIKANVHIKKW